MVLQSMQLKNKVPFKDVLLHGMFRDENGQKMSKSKGNGIDPMEVIEKYGSDSLRFFLLNNTTPGLDLNYNEQKIVDS
jgi:valyl-tRNA synthetase